MRLNSTQLAALAVAVNAAMETEADTKCPAELTIAQWADESGWGAHQPGNNCFGIKCAAGHPGEMLTTEEYLHSARQPITEGQEFETFMTLKACFDRHAQLITTGKRYAAAWNSYQSTPVLPWLIVNVSAMYATDPNYAAKLMRILAMPDVQAALDKARALRQVNA